VDDGADKGSGLNGEKRSRLAKNRSPVHPTTCILAPRQILLNTNTKALQKKGWSPFPCNWQFESLNGQKKNLKT